MLPHAALPGPLALGAAHPLSVLGGVKGELLRDEKAPPGQ